MSVIIDAHAHIFPGIHGRTAAGRVTDAGYGRVRVGHEKLRALPPFCSNTMFSAEALIAHMDWAGVDQAILLQGPFYGECNRYVLDALKAYPHRLSGAAYFDPWARDRRRRVEEILETTGFRAVKLEYSAATGLCGLHPGARLNAADLCWLWNELESEKRVLVFDLGAVGSRSYQTGAVRTIAEGHAGLKIVIAHLGQLTPAVEADPRLWKLWLEQIDLGRLPNVWFDMSALPVYLPGESYPYPTAEKYLRLAIERIGPSKIMWGSDLPGLLLQATYPQLLELARRHTQSLSPAERGLLLGGNALRVYGLDDKRPRSFKQKRGIL